MVILKYSCCYVNTIIQCNFIFFNEKIFNPLSKWQSANSQWMKVSLNLYLYVPIFIKNKLKNKMIHVYDFWAYMKFFFGSNSNFTFLLCSLYSRNLVMLWTWNFDKVIPQSTWRVMVFEIFWYLQKKQHKVSIIYSGHTSRYTIWSTVISWDKLCVASYKPGNGLKDIFRALSTIYDGTFL